MNVTLITETFPPEINGVALTVASMAEGLRDLGHTICIVRPQQPGSIQPAHNGIRHLTLPGLRIPGYSGLRFGLPVVRRLLREWQQRRPDVIYIATEGPLGWAAARVARRLGIPASSGFHTRFDEFASHYGLKLAAPLTRRYLRYFHNQTAATLVPTPELQAWLSQQGYQRVEILPRSIDAQRFHPQHRCQALRQSWGAADDTPVMIFVGRIAPEKNLELTAEAFARLQDHRPRAKMVWVGDGPSRASLQRRHPDHLFTGALHDMALARAWASADLFVFASTTETFGNVTLEALASGLAVLAYDYGAAALTIRHGENGLLAPRGDAQRLLEQVERLGTDSGLYRRVRQGARASIAHMCHQSISQHLAELMASIAEEVPA